MTYVTTKAGNQVAVAEDSRGRTFFIDKAGNLYYDTGDVNIGAYLVSLLLAHTSLLFIELHMLFMST